jgi:4-hydroxy-3-methylbut-2-enyl diphosphate reductase
MAVAALDRTLELFGAPVYVLHEIVHNRFVVEDFRERGVVFVNDPAEVPLGAVLVFSAHGVSPAVRAAAAARGLRVVDATCPLVAKVHLEARRFAREDRPIVMIGHEGHDEVVGTLGHALGRMRLVESVEDVAALDLPADAQPAFLTQTTLSVDDTRVTVQALRMRFPNIVGPTTDDICYASQNRQQAVRELAAEADAVIVFGSSNSSNSRRLAEIAAAAGRPTFLIDYIGELPVDALTGVSTVLITAGASAPEQVVQEGIDHLVRHFGASVETRAIREEVVRFALPRSLHLPSDPTAADGNARPDRPQMTDRVEQELAVSDSRADGCCIRAGLCDRHRGC